MARAIPNNWIDKDGLQKNMPAASEPVNSGNAVTDALADDTFGVRGGGGGSKGGDGGEAFGVIDSSMSKSSPEKGQ